MQQLEEQRKFEDGSKAMTLSMGPQHPSTHGVLRLQIRVDGEKILSVKPDIGYLHRSWEKIVERWTYPQIVPFSDRNDYVGNIFNEHAVCLAVESMMELTPPPRAEHIRVLFDELQRLASHLLWFGTFSMDLGATTAFLWGFREREEVLNIFELVTGGRLFPQYYRLGGVRSDLPPKFFPMINELLELLPKRIQEYHELLDENPIFLERTKDIGILEPEAALDYGVTGPSLRGSGVCFDIRKADPYSIYPELKFEVPVGEKGDVHDRYVVRMKEMDESLRLIHQVLDRMPDGDILAKVPRVFKPPEGETYAHVESGRGEIGNYVVSDGGKEPYRFKWRAPSFSNLHVLTHISPGALLADLVAFIGSVDIVLGEIDR